MPAGRINGARPIPCPTCRKLFSASMVAPTKRKGKAECPLCVKVKKEAKRRRKEGKVNP